MVKPGEWGKVSEMGTGSWLGTNCRKAYADLGLMAAVRLKNIAEIMKHVVRLDGCARHVEGLAGQLVSDMQVKPTLMNIPYDTVFPPHPTLTRS